MRIWQMSTLIDILGQISEFLTVSNRIWDALVVFSGRCKDLQVLDAHGTQEKNNEMRDTDIVCRCTPAYSIRELNKSIAILKFQAKFCQ